MGSEARAGAFSVSPIDLSVHELLCALATIKEDEMTEDNRIVVIICLCNDGHKIEGVDVYQALI